MTKIYFPMFLFVFACLQSNLACAQEIKTDLYGDSLPKGAIARLGTIRLRHEANRTTGMAFSADGKWMATATNNSPDIIVWEVSTGRRVQRFTKQSPDHPDFWSGETLTFSTDGKAVLIKPLYTPKFHRFDLESGKGSVEQKTLLDGGNVAAVSPQGNRVAMVDKDSKNVHVFDLKSAKEIAMMDLPSPGKSERMLKFSANGESLAVGNETSKTIEAWDVESGKSLWKKSTEDEATIAVSPDGKLLMATVGKEGFSVVSLLDGQEIFSQPESRQPASGAFSTDNKRLITADSFGEVTIWNLTEQKKEREIDLDSFTSHVAITPDGSRIVTAYSSDTFRIFDLQTGEETPKFETQFGKISDVRINHDGSRVASVDRQGAIVVWDTNTQKPIYKKKTYTPRAFALAPNGNQLVYGRGTLSFVNLNDKQKKPYHVEVWDQCEAIAYSPDGKYLAAADRIGKEFYVSVIDASNGKKLHKQSVPSIPRTLCWFADNQRIVVGDSSGGIHIWKMGDTKMQTTLKSPDKGGVGEVAIHANGKALATIEAVSFGRGGKLCLWHLGQEKRLEDFQFAGFEDESDRKKASNIQFSRDGQFLIALSSAKCFLWSIDSRKLVHQMGDATNLVSPAAISGDGKRMVTCSSAEHMVVWDIDQLKSTD